MHPNNLKPFIEPTPTMADVAMARPDAFAQHPYDVSRMVLEFGGGFLREDEGVSFEGTEWWTEEYIFSDGSGIWLEATKFRSVWNFD